MNRISTRAMPLCFLALIGGAVACDPETAGGEDSSTPVVTTGDADREEDELDDSDVPPIRPLVSTAGEVATLQEHCNTSVSSWLLPAEPGNGWRTYANGKKRVRAWIEGESCRQTTSDRLYVNHRLHIEAQKKNFWGTWKPNQDWPAYWVAGHWDYEYSLKSPSQIITEYTNALPVPQSTPPTFPSPLNNSGPDFNHRILQLAPHVAGYYEESSQSSFASNVSVTNVHFDIVADGQAMDIHHQCQPKGICPYGACGDVDNGCGAWLYCGSCPPPAPPPVSLCGDGVTDHCEGEQCEPGELLPKGWLCSEDCALSCPSGNCPPLPTPTDCP